MFHGEVDISPTAHDPGPKISNCQANETSFMQNDRYCRWVNDRYRLRR